MHSLARIINITWHISMPVDLPGGCHSILAALVKGACSSLEICAGKSGVVKAVK